MHRLLVLVLLIVPRVVLGDDAAVSSSLIPFDSLTVTNRMLVRSVTDHCTLRRFYPTRQFKARKEHFDWLVGHMEACWVLGQKAGLITYRGKLDQQGRLYADNHEGSKGYLLLVYATQSNHVFYVEGSHQDLFNTRGRGVAVLNTVQKSPQTIEYTSAAFVKVDNRVLAALARLFAVFLQGTVDHHFDHVMGHPIKLSELALIDPQKLLAFIQQMPEDDGKLLRPFAAMLRPATNTVASSRL